MKSYDIDMFSISSLDLAEIDFWLKKMWSKDYLMIRESPYFLSILIRDIKVDFVIDPMSIQEAARKKQVKYPSG